MEIVEHPVFGDVEFEQDSEFQWSDDVEFADGQVDFELTVEDTSAGISHLLDTAAPFISRLAEFDALARDTLRGEYGDKFLATVEYYREQHPRPQAAAPTAATNAAVPARANSGPDTDGFVAALQLRRVALNPETEEACAVFDYVAEDAVEIEERLVISFDDHHEVSAIEIV